MNGSFGLAGFPGPAAKIAAGDEPLWLTASAAVAARDLLVLSQATGGVRKLDEPLLGAIDNSTAIGIKAIGSARSVASTATLAYKQPATCRLANGNIVMVYSGGTGSGTTSGIRFQIFDAAGGTVLPMTLALDVTQTEPPTVVALPAGFAIIRYAGGPIRMMVFSSAGALLNADVEILSNPSNGNAAGGFSACGLSNGQIAVAWRDTSNNAYLSFFSAAGALQGSHIFLNSSESPNYGPVLQAPNGDIVVVWYRSTSTTATKVARYTLARAQVGTTVALASGAQHYFGLPQGVRNAVVCTDGSVFLLHADSSGSGFSQLTRINPLNTASQLVHFVPSSSSNYICIATDGVRVYLVNYGGSVTQAEISIYSAGGATLMPATLVTHAAGLNTALSVSTTGMALLVASGYGFAVTFIGHGNATLGQVQTLLIARDLSTSQVTTPVATGGLGRALIQSGQNVMSFWQGASDAILCKVEGFDRASIVGVAVHSAAPGAGVRVHTRGTHTVTQSLPALHVSRPASPQIGVRAVIAGNRATLFGVEEPS